MTIHIPLVDLTEQIRKLYLEDKIKGMGIDYVPNAIMGWVDDREVEVFNFGKVCKMDNRWSGYELYCSPTGIVIDIVW